MAKILIVDDEPSIRELYNFIFSDAGHEVLQAENGQAALETLQEHTPDFMVVDVSMPVMTGKEFITELWRRARTDGRLSKIPFCVMTGENFMEAELNSAFATMPGFVCYFPKMVVPEQVLAKAEEELARQR
jgi:two-component system chemotaxis response regulator CheY